MPRTIETAPMANAAILATLTSCWSVAVPRLNTCAYRSWAKLDDEASVRPATTARIVANATAAITASRIVPPASPKMPPPTFSASCGAAVLPALF